MPAVAMSPTPGESAAREEREQGLLRAVARRERTAFEALYIDYHRRLSRFLARLTHSPELIEEVINDTFWIVWQKAGQFRGQSRVSTWIMGIAYRCTLCALRGGGSLPMENREPTEAELGSPAPQEALDQRDWLDKGLRHLPEDQRITLQLVYYLGHSCEEVAEIMACPIGTVKARMFHARVRLRNLLPALGGLQAGESR